MNEREFHLARLYIHREGWRLTLLETINFTTGRDWALFTVGWNCDEGFIIAVGAT